MPKEVMYSESRGDTTAPNVVIGWSPDQYVEVGLVLPDPKTSNIDPSLIRVLYGDKWVLVGQAVRERLEAVGCKLPDWQALPDAALGSAVLAALDDTSRYASWWTSLGRPSINRMIRTLRRARDQAYGRDE